MTSASVDEFVQARHRRHPVVVERLQAPRVSVVDHDPEVPVQRGQGPALTMRPTPTISERRVNLGPGLATEVRGVKLVDTRAPD